MPDTRVVIVIVCLIYAQIIHALEEHAHNVKNQFINKIIDIKDFIK